MFEEHLGQNLPKPFKTIDKNVYPVATSIKSLDLDLKTYLDPKELAYTLKRYTNKMANFVEGQLGRFEVKYGRDFTERALDLILPHNGNPAQQSVISQAIEYARTKGVKLNIIIVQKR